MFEFVVDGPPVSQQARRRDRVRQWSQEVRNAAERYWPPGELPIAGPISLTITYFYDGVAVDVDNIPKPLMDALKGLVYLDDDQVTELVCRKQDLKAGLRVASPSSVLVEGFSRGNDFLYIVVEEAPEQEVIE